MRAYVILAVAACGMPSRPGSVVPPGLPPVSPRSLAGYPPPIEPSSIRCTLEGKWEHRQPRTLSLRTGSKRFATVYGVSHARLGLVGSSAFVELATPAERIWGFVPLDQMIVHARQPFLIADYVVPGPTTGLHVRSANRGGISVEMKLPGYVKAATSARSVRACADLSLRRWKYDPRSMLPAPIETWQQLADNAAIPLSVDPGTPAIAELRFDLGPATDVLERHGDRARVAVHAATVSPGDDSLIFGWVPASALGPHTHRYGRGGTHAIGVDSKAPRSPPRAKRRVSCGHEVPLVLDFDGEQHLVGAITPRNVIGLVGEAGDFIEVDLRDSYVELTEDARFLAKRTALDGCADAR